MPLGLWRHFWAPLIHQGDFLCLSLHDYFAIILMYIWSSSNPQINLMKKVPETINPVKKIRVIFKEFSVFNKESRVTRFGYLLTSVNRFGFLLLFSCLFHCQNCQKMIFFNFKTKIKMSFFSTIIDKFEWDLFVLNSKQ